MPRQLNLFISIWVAHVLRYKGSNTQTRNPLLYLVNSIQISVSLYSRPSLIQTSFIQKLHYTHTKMYSTGVQCSERLVHYPVHFPCITSSQRVDSSVDNVYP